MIKFESRVSDSLFAKRVKKSDHRVTIHARFSEYAFQKKIICALQIQVLT